MDIFQRAISFKKRVISNSRNRKIDMRGTSHREQGGGEVLCLPLAGEDYGHFLETAGSFPVM